jgi:hypothetical protein
MTKFHFHIHLIPLRIITYILTRTAQVANAALEAFENAIPKKKRNQVCVYLSSPLLKYIADRLAQKPETLSDMTHCTQDEAEERFERVNVACINGLRRLLALLSDEENAQVLVRI